jgi:hypothetical protein
MAAHQANTDILLVLTSIAIGLGLVECPTIRIPGLAPRVNYDAADHLMRLLAVENDKSVSQRYNEKPTDKEFPGYNPERAFRLAANLSPVQALKLCAYYEYQACEHAGWRSSYAKEVIDSIRAATIRKLPGFADAAWGL